MKTKGVLLICACWKHLYHHTIKLVQTRQFLLKCQWRERSYIYTLGVSMLPLSTTFRLDFGTVPTMLYFFFPFFTTLYRTMYTIKSGYLNLDIHDLPITPPLWYYCFVGCKCCYVLLHQCIIFFTVSDHGVY